jgi:hypothetical protein
MANPRNFVCLLTGAPCIEGECKSGERCIEREREEAAFHQAQAQKRREWPIIDPATGKVIGVRTDEDLGL